jgi:hypothetical protein
MQHRYVSFEGGMCLRLCQNTETRRVSFEVSQFGAILKKLVLHKKVDPANDEFVLFSPCTGRIRQ